ncbi:reverse transcriptase (RNA-dependent DNA polymerase) [Buttiauxella sp. BIGb0552]|uniref:antiviral reverse transcriptase Drt3a n=1 Tax=Buttiauxella sp. BIGb0552 TaxID=2485120 RepID=UPI0010652956|nr:antiviral reverse transcriptase Drt3a [Buttiauxella sp. BIGb0552]TDX15113.1 reverse transcriptase (RNA-dependent DNA polymerase) [Buttiauxella sp. BIGb0552]
MIDQSFSAKNFRRIYDLDRKNKGTLEVTYFPKAYRIRKKIIQLKGFINWLSVRHKNGQLSLADFEEKKEKVNGYIEIRKEQYNNEIDENLKVISNNVSAKGYALPLMLLPKQVKNKNVYSIGNSVETLFASQQIKCILSSLYRIKSNNRDLIISRLSALAKEMSLKYIIRADVENFYESINHKSLLDILHSSPKLSVPPRRVITQLIRKYQALTGLDKGLPRGVGVSAYLSELYMSVVDDKIRALPDVTYYERFVDDLIIIFSPDKGKNTGGYLHQVTNIINERGLSLNSKTKELDLFTQSNKDFEYLGYKFQLTAGGCNIKMSSNKIQKIQKIQGRIDKSFNEYNQSVKKTPRKAVETILLRMKFLTGNTRLYNSKSKAFVGIYFSNRFITDLSDLNGLDSYLLNKINSLQDPKLQKRISRFSFNKGFEDKIFRKFSFIEFSEISKGWSHV